MKKILSIKSIIFFVVILFVLSFIMVGFGSSDSNNKDQELIEKLDAYELHFDAGSYFIVINPMYNDVGIYYGPYPMKHFTQEFDWSGDRWVGEYQDLIKRGIILNEEIYTYLHVTGFPDDTPVIIMNFSVE